MMILAVECQTVIVENAQVRRKRRARSAGMNRPLQSSTNPPLQACQVGLDEESVRGAREGDRSLRPGGEILYPQFVVGFSGALHAARLALATDDDSGLRPA